MLSGQNKKVLLNKLLSIKLSVEEGVVDKCEGICNILAESYNKPYTIFYGSKENSYLKHLFKKWPLFSGDECYPVPARKGVHPEDAFESEYCLYKWNKRTAYGRNRIKLLEFLISEIKEDLNSTPKI